ncbi:MAG: CBS domain-containing protein [Rhizobiaceae bacterium]
MNEGYDEDLAMYEEAGEQELKKLDNDALMRPIGDLDYPTSPAAVTPDQTIGDVIEQLAQRRIGALLVTQDERLVGIFAERDLLLKELWKGDKLNRPVSEFMNHDPDTLTPDDTIAFALNRMVEGGYRNVPLVDLAQRPVGLLTMRDVMAHVISYFPAEVINVPPHSEHNPPDRSVDGG